MINATLRYLALWVAAMPMALAATVDLADKPLASGTSGEVKPNVMIILDDSGSMSFSYMPDDAVKFHNRYGYLSNQCNGIYYNPDVVYKPPVDVVGNPYPDAIFTAARDDGFDSSTPARNLDSEFIANRFVPESANNTYNSNTYKPYTRSSLGPWGATYYVYTGSQTTRNYENTSSTFYRECNSSIGDTPGSNVFTKRRLATTMTTTITVSGASSTSVTSIKVNGVELMSGATSSSSTSSTVASRIAAAIANGGYSATSSGNTVTITGPASAANHEPVIQKSGGGTLTTDVFPETDPVKLTNFANWYSYYRVRLLAAKTAVGQALAGLSEPSNYRIGYTTHSYTGTNTSSSSFQMIDDFCDGATGCDQRTKIYDKLYGAGASGGTPLRAALSKVGRIYAGKTGNDPVQYSCQQNFAILTTDGFWNGDAGYKIDGSSSIGNQDSSAARPMWDGATSEQRDTYRRYLYSLSTNGCSSGRQRVRRQEQRMTVTTPVMPTAGDPIESAWTNQGSQSNFTSCQSPAPALPSSPSAPELISSTTSSSGGTSHSLSDVAMYYYATDLRTPALGNCTGTLVNGKTYDVCENNVPGGGSDTASHQHMTTFTLGLGVDGSMHYCENYDSGGCTDFEAIKQGTKIWPDPMDAEDLHRVDDLWHAAVNGRGKYFSARSPEALAKGIQKALAGVSARTASAAAAATSNLEPVAGDNYAYVAMYTTVEWDGEIAAREIDLSVGTVSETGIWSARGQVDSKVSTTTDTRTILFNGGGTLKDFTETNLGAEIGAKYFDAGPDNPNGQLSQWALLTPDEQAQATPASIIGFLRGQTEYEDESTNTWKLYRDRKHALGDIVNAAPVYVRKPPFTYSDDNYSTFAETRKGRKAIVYAGANDGLLHAFDGDTGNELWAFIPTSVIPRLYTLADKSYSTNHRFHVDGPLTVGDVCLTVSCDASQWNSILVGGLGKGGRSYYALDVTNPTSPKLLWEFTDPNLGYSYGNAIITKRNGEWVVIVASGYNNISPGDGKGRLFVLRASDGTKLAEIVTDNALTDPSRSGIAKVNNWVDQTMLDNSTRHVYGGDLDGNVWRFDIVSETATRITTIGKGDVPTQPITAKPELAEVKIGGTPTRVILVGTGKYLGTSDVGSTDRMSLYAIRDNLASVGYGNFRTRPDVVVQDLSGDTGSRQISYTAMAPDKIGWYMDLDVKNGERVNVDPKLQMGWWVVPSNIPDPNVCNIGGTSWLYFIDPWPAKTKAADPATIVNVGNALIVGINIVKLPNGKTVTIVTTSDAKYPVFGNPMAPFTAQVRRLYWRELTR